MGSIVTLGIDRFELDWGKNHSFADHSELFTPSDVLITTYVDEDSEERREECLSRPLESVKQRLDLLGYSLTRLPSIYQEHLDYVPDYYPEVPISFEDFSRIFRSIDLSKTNQESEYQDHDLGEFVSRIVFNDPELKQYLPKCVEVDSDAGTFFENLHPYIALRLLAENEKNSKKLVQWNYNDILEGGWVERSEVAKPLNDRSRILVVTEGSTDTYVIKRSIAELLPDVSDFFDFIDMEQSYPFTGTGNLYNFCKGLARINIQNKVLVVFDNDAAGLEKYEQSLLLDKPKNLHICRLPDHESFSDFPTIGPTGSKNENINGSAVSIECFLDLNTIAESQRLIRWTSFNRKTNSYQGEFEKKDDLISGFKKSNLKDGSYDTSKLDFLLSYLINEWIKNQ